ncbi:uncharacterized protein LOC142418961 isoform X2 [Mycteria americana]|uniref:uncharacterized protein LOC142418961 isoform X2 n=1 Tax=Mycteria americana TaxID=33587 RepID=UPI003F58A840
MESRGFVASSSIPVFSSIFGMCCLWQRLVVIFVVGAAEILAGAGDGFGGRRDRSHGASAGFAGILKHPYPGKIVAPVFPLLLPGDGSLIICVTSPPCLWVGTSQDPPRTFKPSPAIARWQGNVAWDRVLGKTLACAIPVCPQPGVGHLHPILRSQFSPISLGWKTVTSIRSGDCKNKWLVFMAWLSAQRVLVSRGVRPPGAAFSLRRLSFERRVRRGKGFEMLPLQVTAAWFSTSVCLASLADSLKNTRGSEDNED